MGPGIPSYPRLPTASGTGSGLALYHRGNSLSQDPVTLALPSSEREFLTCGRGVPTMRLRPCKGVQPRAEGSPEMGSPVCMPTLSLLPEKGSWLDLSPSSWRNKVTWHPSCSRFRIPGTSASEPETLSRQRGLRLGKCQSSLPARTTPAAPPAHCLPPYPVSLPAGGHSPCHQGRGRCGTH